jgi:hypothetical protein
MRRWLAAGLGIATIVTLVVAGALSWLPGPDPMPPVAQLHGLPILTVSQALLARPTLEESEPIAVHGWFSSGLAHSCPAPSRPDGGMRQTSEIEMYCHRGEIVLAERNESPMEVTRNGTDMSARIRQLSGPHLDPVFRPLAVVQPIEAAGMDPWRPQSIVAIGHFADHRAADCLPEDLAFCLGVLVVDNIAMIRGTETNPVRLIDPQHGAPDRTLDEMEAFVAAKFGPGAAVITLASTGGDEIPTYEDRAPSRPDLEVVWLIRLIDRGPGGTDPARLVTEVVADESLEVIWSTDPD